MMTLEPPRGVPEGAEGWRSLGLSRVRLARFAEAAQEAVGLRGNVDVLLSSDTVLKRLNREYRGKDQATDVLSFPAAEQVAAEHAGDLAISLQTAARQARQHGHTLEEEVRVLLLHGLLHLHGMDHEADRGEMAEREATLREKLKLPVGLIGRTEGTAQESGGSQTRVRTSGPGAPSSLAPSSPVPRLLGKRKKVAAR